MTLNGDIQVEIISETPTGEEHEWFDFIMATEVDGYEIPK